jgi:DNA-binding transcriptional MerR regulator
MFKIGDFSQMGQISVRMLRHYDKMDLLKPSHIDESSGYRYYTIDQLPRLNRIAALKDLGLTLQQITNLLAEDLPLERLQAMLEKKQQDIQTQMREEMARLNRIAARLRQIEYVKTNLPPTKLRSSRYQSNSF